jgi:diguanylate cyclase (GGDEF)-like protein
MIRGAVVLALAAVFIPCSVGAASAAGTQPPVAQILAPLPGDVERASLVHPADFVAAFRVPHIDTALYIVAPWYVSDLTVTIVGPGHEQRTLIATDDLPGRVLGVRLPSDAWSADRLELRATTVSDLVAPYLIDADDLAIVGWQYWWYAALFGLFVALVVVFGTVALIRRRRMLGWFAAAMAGQAGLLVPWLGIVRPPPQVSQPLHAVCEVLVLAALTGLALRYVQRARLPRAVPLAAWALVLIAAAMLVTGDVLQDFWTDTADKLEEGTIAVLMLFVAALGVVAVRLRVEGAWFFLAGTAVAAACFIAYVVTGFAPTLRDPLMVSHGVEAILLALAIVMPPRGDRARIGSRDDVDGLTGIANRAALDAWLAQAGRERRHASHSTAAVLLDLDRFRAYNETYGHAAGDDALRRVAALVARSAGGGDLAGRYGNDQFLLLLGASDLTAAKRVGAELANAVATLAIAHGAAASKRLSVSVGVASSVVRHGDRSELIRRVTAALYVAKTMGRNRVVADEAAAPVSGR